MKLTLKQSSIAMAVCASLYLALLVAYQIPVAANFLYQCQLLPYLPQALLLVGIIVMGMTLYFNAHQLPTLTKLLKWQAVCLGVIILGIILYNLIPINSIHINGFRHCYWHSSWMRIAMVAWLTAWLWQYAFVRTEDTFQSKGVNIASVVFACVASLILVLMIVSCIHVIMYDHVAGFKTRGWLSWLLPLIAVGFLGTYLYGETKVSRTNATDMTHTNDTPNPSDKIHTFSRSNRIIAWITTGGLIIYIPIGIIGLGLDWFENYAFNMIYSLPGMCLAHMLWISSVVAMLLEKSLQRWLRILNILAPLIINGAIVLAVMLMGLIPDEMRWDFQRSNLFDLLNTGFFLCIAFPSIVWLTNTYVVFQASWKKHNLKG